MKTTKLLLLVMLFTQATVAMAQDDDPFYLNPVVATSLPDPTVIKVGDYFYLYATEDIRNVPVYRSKNLIDWKQVGTAFTESTRPRFVQNGGIWAPDINYINGQYVLYYSMSTWGGEWQCGIGCATSSSPNGRFTDHGKMFISSEIGVQNSIDPFYYEEEDGSKYLFWGSFRGIYAIQLSDDGLSIKEGAKKVQVAGTLTEATYIYKHDGYYYLIGSAGSCCEGLNSTYRLVVARSKNILGPYESKEGKPALENGFSNMLLKSADVVGPGHCSEIVQDDAGQDWILYHGYMANDVDAGRVVFLDRVRWDEEGWPYIYGMMTSTLADKPVIGTNVLEEQTYTPVEYLEYNDEDAISRYFFDTGYVPKYNTRIEVKCQSYQFNAFKESSSGKWRAIYSGRNSFNNGLSLYQNYVGNQWGYFAGGYINDYVGHHAFGVDYIVTGDANGVTINGEHYATNHGDFNATTEHLRIFSGQQDYPYIGRIYYLKVYEGDVLVHIYQPAIRESDSAAGFLDRVTGEFLMPTVFGMFGCGDEIDAIDVIADDVRDRRIYNLQGQQMHSAPQRGIYIQGSRIVVRP